jgi:hypothetical protein
VLHVAEQRARVTRSGRVGLTVACPSGGLTGCRVVLELRTVARGHRRSVRLGRAFAAIIPGARKRLTVAVPRGARARLAARGTRVTVLLRLDEHSPARRQQLTLLPATSRKR